MPAREELRVLVTCYAFPPVGGAGVQRVLKLVKYLPDHGVSPSVLTVKNPSAPLRDLSLALEVPAEVEVVRAATLEPGYRMKALAWHAVADERPNGLARGRAAVVTVMKSLLVPDPQVLWLPGATLALGRRLASGRDDVVFVSAPPFSTLLLGALARLRPGTAVVFDYRDEWTTTRSAYEMKSGPIRHVDPVLERWLLHAAHAVTTATEAFRRELLARFSFLDPALVHTIENGYDPADRIATPPRAPSDRLVLTYVGTVFRLTSAVSLLEALRLLAARAPALASKLEVRFVGRIVATEERHFVGSDSLGVRRLGYVEHARALEELARSHVALCLLDDVPGAERVYPAKIFEIMQLEKPCLAICPRGALADLVRSHALGQVVSARDPQAIAEALAALLTRFVDGSLEARTSPLDIERYDRRRQAGAFAAVFREAAETAQRLHSGAGAAQRTPDSSCA
jgi:glycosyltransferase involved in cell wall biosynthesis